MRPKLNGADAVEVLFIILEYLKARVPTREGNRRRRIPGLEDETAELLERSEKALGFFIQTDCVN